VSEIPLSKRQFFEIVTNTHLPETDFTPLFPRCLSPGFCIFNPHLALLVEGTVVVLVALEAGETGFQLRDVFESPGFFDGAFQHEWVGGALAEPEELYHEDGVIAAGLTVLEKDVEICAEAVFCLFLDFSSLCQM
jgi:hypothetical protein